MIAGDHLPVAPDQLHDDVVAPGDDRLLRADAVCQLRLDRRDFLSRVRDQTNLQGVVQAQDEKHTVLRIDAIFVEDFRHVAHASNGSVEGAEYKDIHDHLDSIELMKTEAAEAGKTQQESSSRKQQIAFKDETAEPSIQPPPSPKVTQPPPVPAETVEPTSVEPVPSVSLEQRVHTLKQQVQRIVKAPGAPLKSAPFHSASS